MYNKSVNI